MHCSKIQSLINNRHRFPRYLWRLSLPFLCLFLTGCISLQAPKANTNYSAQSVTKHQQQLSQITCWSIQGAFSLRSPQQSEIANYHWTVKSNDQYTLQITSAMNIYSITIQRADNQTTLINNKQQTITATTPEALLQQVIGYSIPVSNLYYWVRGLAAPGQSQAKYNEYGHLTHLDQNGWQIDFSKYSHQNDVDLPQTLLLTRSQLSIKLIIKQWQTNCRTPTQGTP